ncbi:MAG: cytochrome c3 family protein [Candidatus Aminicenantes bacterium]|nr:MAG: cytochrome c3 family protein [Candidatus Aminicenantes bacterium]
MMKQRLILLLGFGFVLVIAILAVIIYWPWSTEALNPDHGTCAICHSIHSAPGQSLTNEDVVEVLCLSCHGPGGTATKKAEVHKNKDGSSYSFFMTCPDCHDPHDHRGNWLGGTNLAQVGKKLDSSGDAMIPTPNSGDRYVVFESRGTDAGGPSLHSFADNDEDGNTYYDGACEACHTLALNHRNNSSGNHSHYTGTNCMVCHPHDGFFHGAGGGCIACHSTPKGSRRAVVGEFSLTSHHVMGGAVTDDDCGVCHYEAQGDHGDGNVDLLDPDSGGRLTPFVAFSRNTASDSLESWVIDVQDNLCLKCHDVDGATATNFSGNALQPFSSADRDVPNVFAQFDTSNSYHHAVRGPGNNSYCNSNTMEPPWNQAGDHDVISCFDCHEAGGHGSSNQRMLRNAIDLVTMENAVNKGDLPTGMGVSVEAFCIRCHKSTEYVGGGSFSIFEFHGDNQNQHRGGNSNELGCMGCHGGIVNMWHTKQGVALPNGHARGNIHGGNFTWTADSFADGTDTEHFMVGGWNSGWQIIGATGYCRGGDCNHDNSSKDYTR